MWTSRKENAKKKRHKWGQGTSFDDGKVAFLPQLSWVILLTPDGFCEIILAYSGASCGDCLSSFLEGQSNCPRNITPRVSELIKVNASTIYHLFKYWHSLTSKRINIGIFFCPSFLSNKLIPLAVLHINAFSRTNSFQTVVSQTSK